MYAPARPLLEEPLKGFEWLQSPMVCPRQAGCPPHPGGLWGGQREPRAGWVGCWRVAAGAGVVAHQVLGGGGRGAGTYPPERSQRRDGQAIPPFPRRRQGSSGSLARSLDVSGLRAAESEEHTERKAAAAPCAVLVLGPAVSSKNANKLHELARATSSGDKPSACSRSHTLSCSSSLTTSAP